ncbi:MAG: phosphatase PAP2 family protein [Luteimonas sp.]
MFESDPILWLQQFSASWFFGFMRFMSWVGEAWFYIPAVLVVVFGTRLRPGMGVLLALLLVTFATEGFKQGYGLPRPSEVDARVLYKGESGRHLVADGAADTFWGLPSDDAIAAKRATHDPSFGFVSGHTSAATVFALALALFFGARQRWIWALVVAWPLLMGLSRMYLGRHFLADVLGGLAVGVAGGLLAWALMRRFDAPWARAWRSWAAALGGVCALAAAAWWVPWIDPGMAGEVAGILLCIGALMRFGWPDGDTGWLRRLARMACGLAFGYGTIWLLETTYAATGWPDRHPGAFFFAAGGFAGVLLGTVLVSRWLGLYRPPPVGAAADT